MSDKNTTRQDNRTNKKDFLSRPYKEEKETEKKGETSFTTTNHEAIAERARHNSENEALVTNKKSENNKSEKSKNQTYKEKLNVIFLND